MKILKINLTRWSLVFLALTMQTIKSEMVLDETFGTGGIVRAGAEKTFTALTQSNEKLIVANRYDVDQLRLTCHNFARYTRDGSPDETFRSCPIGEGFVTSLAVQQNNQFIAALTRNKITESFLYRYNPNGPLDESFSPQLNRPMKISFILQQDDKIITVEKRERDPETYFFRYNPDGSLDRSFQIQNVLDVVTSLLVQPDGKIVVIGISRDLPVIIRYNANGSLDTTFGPEHTGYRFINFPERRARFESLALQPHSNKLIVAGTFTIEYEKNGYFIVCYNPDGTFDTSFGAQRNGGLIVAQPLFIHSIVIKTQPNGKILVLNGDKVDCYNPDGTPDRTFGPDGTHVLTLPNVRGSDFLFDSDTQTLTIMGNETLPDGRAIGSILIRYRTLSPAEIEQRRLAAQEIARLNAFVATEIQDLMRVELLETCQICLEEAAIQNLIETECGHLFHPTCIPGPEKCSVCLTNIQNNDLFITPCRHFFHSECMTGWRNSGEAAANSCPMCRADLPVLPEQNEDLL